MRNDPEWKREGMKYTSDIKVGDFCFHAVIAIEDGFLGRRFGGTVDGKRVGSASNINGCKDMILDHCCRKAGIIR